MPIRVIPVLDLKGGLAVRARAGDRDHYAPLSGSFHPGSDPAEWSAALRNRLGLDVLYLADLDAITAGRPQVELIRRVIEPMSEVWLDGGFRDVETTSPWLEEARVTFVLGLETVAGPDALGRIVANVEPDRAIFSLDLRDGDPLCDRILWGEAGAREIVRQVISCGVRRVILLDLKRVGVGRGPGTLELLSRLAAEFSGVEWIVGGGVSSRADLDALGETRASSVLIGTAIYDQAL